MPRVDNKLASIVVESNQLHGQERLDISVSDTKKIYNVAATSIKTGQQLNRVGRFKELLGLNVTTQMASSGNTVRVSVNVNSLAKNLGLTSFNERRFLKKILQQSGSVQKTIQLITLANRKGLTKYGLEGKGKETASRLIAAENQGLEVTSENLSPQEEIRNLSLKNSSTGKSHKVAMQIIKKMGSGGFNQVDLAWNPKERKFYAVRSPKEINPKNSMRFRRDTTTNTAMYEVLKKYGNEQEMQLIETPDLLDEDEAVSVRELAGGDLRDNLTAFQKTPKSLVGPLLRQLTFFIKSGIGMGDVKPANINLYKNDKGELVPKFSDIDGGVCLEIATENLSSSWQALLNDHLKGKSQEEIKEFLLECGRGNFFPVSDSKELSNEKGEKFREAFLNVTKLSTTSSMVLRGENLRDAFLHTNANIIARSLLSSARPMGKLAEVGEGVKMVVQRIQYLDAACAAISIVRALLGNVDAVKLDDHIRNILDKDSNSSQGSFDEIKVTLNSFDKKLSKEDRIGSEGINVLMDMLKGKVDLDKSILSDLAKKLGY
jgi:hypothetical protein